MRHFSMDHWEKWQAGCDHRAEKSKEILFIVFFLSFQQIYLILSINLNNTAVKIPHVTNCHWKNMSVCYVRHRTEINWKMYSQRVQISISARLKLSTPQFHFWPLFQICLLRWSHTTIELQPRFATNLTWFTLKTSLASLLKWIWMENSKCDWIAWNLMRNEK